MHRAAVPSASGRSQRSFCASVPNSSSGSVPIVRWACHARGDRLVGMADDFHLAATKPTRWTCRYRPTPLAPTGRANRVQPSLATTPSGRRSSFHACAATRVIYLRAKIAQRSRRSFRPGEIEVHRPSRFASGGRGPLAEDIALISAEPPWMVSARDHNRRCCQAAVGSPQPGERISVGAHHADGQIGDALFDLGPVSLFADATRSISRCSPMSPASAAASTAPTRRPPKRINSTSMWGRIARLPESRIVQRSKFGQRAGAGRASLPERKVCRRCRLPSFDAERRHRHPPAVVQSTDHVEQRRPTSSRNSSVDSLSPVIVRVGRISIRSLSSMRATRS